MKNGFSLLELLITITILVIMGMLTYPNYQNYLTRAHRLDGQTSLLLLANQLELYYSAHHTYKTATIGAGLSTDVLSHAETPEHWYALSILKATDSSYLLQATPLRSQATNDRLCQSLRFNSNGTREIAAGPMGSPSGSMEQCW